MGITYKSKEHFDVVGSFLRPEILKKARIDFSDGKISDTQLKKIEDEEIQKLIEKEKNAGLSVITDGEFRRATWHLDFMWGFSGVGHHPTDRGAQFHDEIAKLDETYLTGKLSVSEHPFVEHYKFIKSFEDDKTEAKQTLPSPAQFLKQMTSPLALENTGKFYQSIEELSSDIADGYKKILNDLYKAGCRTVQFDDCTFGMLVDKSALQRNRTDEAGLQKIIERFVDINNRVIAQKPSDMVINTHVCRGNFHSTWGSSGPYDRVADTLFGKENVNSFYLEFDDERSGGFSPLRHVSENKNVVLGLITTKRAELEDKQKIIERIHEASKYVPLERLYLSPQCGFASCEIGNKLSEEEQWKKIALVKEIAKEFWN